MNPVVSPEVLEGFFALAPLVLGVGIYAIAWFAKRSELSTVPAMLAATYACAQCGRRGSREHMVPQIHNGAVSYRCAHCG